MNERDILIVGAGTAGLTAAIYVQRAGRHAVLFEKSAPGGQIVTANEIQNYPGFVSVNGADFAYRLYDQAVRLGAEFLSEEVLEIIPADHSVTVRTAAGTRTGRALIYAAGASHRRLGLPEEEKLIGKGISFCANCDGAFFRDKRVAVNGGGNTALDDAVYLSRMASEVYLIHRRKEYRAEEALQKQIAEIGNIHPILDTVITGLKENDGHLSGLRLQNKDSGEETELAAEGLFLAIGMKPETGLLKGIVKLDDAGYIIASEDTRTDVPNIFAAGDVRKKQVRQLTTAAADGTAAAIQAVSL
ncbi:NAD(P)/FAD-dependent oxidoreductase [Anaerolactibacter massiliensis]|uniref:NAD(P)/FAD-dependent oxidoreductase n=1 Tax=Anaerolactibacter massiliensis TaxID=2044573 RepID=UPI000CF8F5B5|nr:FAD-dependent oxidoreductase [Anaerolactibacter massiliensis]